MHINAALRRAMISAWPLLIGISPTSRVTTFFFFLRTAVKPRLDVLEEELLTRFILS